MNPKTNEMNMGLLEEMRPELTSYCYRMLGSIFDADDAVQDTFIRAWQGWERFRQDSSPRTWMYRIATNVCLDKLRHASRRALPMDMSNPVGTIAEPQSTLPYSTFIWPTPDAPDDPELLAIRKDTLRLTFIALLQTLPPRQRAVLILQEAFRWSAIETGEVLGMTPSAVHSALQRARMTMHRANLKSEELRDTDGEKDHQLLSRYVEAFEQYDINKLVMLFHENGSLSMPPYDMWVRGWANLVAFYSMTRNHCHGSRLMPVTVNGRQPAFAQYMPTDRGEHLVPWGIHVPEVKNGLIVHVHIFIDASLYPRFGLPTQLIRHAD